jgi:hypothetical protein
MLGDTLELYCWLTVIVVDNTATATTTPRYAVTLSALARFTI